MDPDYQILALDLATTTGWARSRLDGDAHSSGAFRLKGDYPEEKGAVLATWIIDMYRVSPFHHLIYEAPLPVSHMGGKTNVNTTQIGFGLPMVAGAIALKLGVKMTRIKKVKPNDVRKHFIGKRSAGSREDTKRAVIMRCRQLGWHPADDNEADALAVLDYQRALLNASYGAASGPLFTTKE